MFGKKKCGVCGNKLDGNCRFCPYCGSELRKSQGLLDEINENFVPMPSFGMNLNSFPLNKIIEKMTKGIDKQFRDIDRSLKAKEDARYIETKKEPGKKPKIFAGGLSISISSDGNEPVIKVKSFGDDIGKIKMSGMPMMIGMPAQARQIEKTRQSSIKEKKLTKEQESRIKKLQKTEPQTTVRRLSNRIIYEIELPGVNEKDVIINKLQNSIEIKAFTKDRVFFKLIPIFLPILSHKLNKGKLILELRPEA